MIEKQHIPVTGGCLCGELRYEMTDSPTNGGYCHCGQCKRTGGGLFGAHLQFNSAAFKFTQGEPKYYYLPLGRRGFCVNCGSPVIFAYLDDDDSIWVPVGSLDHPGDWPFDTEGWIGHISVEDKVSWYEIRDGLTQHQKSSAG